MKSTFVKISYSCSGDTIEIFTVSEDEAKDPKWKSYKLGTIVIGAGDNYSLHSFGDVDPRHPLFFVLLSIHYKP